MKVKLCGFSDLASVVAAVNARADFIGFVFCSKSVRYVTPEKAAEISQIIPATIAKVAVLADNDLESIKKIYKNLAPQYFQFHGLETPEFLLQIKKIFPEVKIIKAFRISNEQDLTQVKNFEEVSDLFLFDSKALSFEGAVGGTGQVFDWTILSKFKSNRDWFLSGGLNVNNFSEAVKITGAKMIDISSGIEKIRGQKSVELIEQLMRKIKNHAS
jgi:phosphoribosylanthranilate isomerase